MGIFSFLAAFLLFRRLLNSVKLTKLGLKWSSLLTIGLWGSIGAYIIIEIFLHDRLIDLTGGLALGASLFFLEKETDFAAFHAFIRAHYPLVAATVLAGLTQLIAPAFYDKYDNYFDILIVAGFVWIFARLASSKKQIEEFKIINEQNKELDRMVAERTAELTEQKNELENTVALLQTTQQQLIQSEKLASLGELTAGIAHEIQNPLNFVNNFSEVSVELLDEMQLELNNGDKDEAIAIAGDIKQNLEKIIHHGKRADGIVKGMLQHSRASNGVKEAVDINNLADEYLRLAYHGLRAKDKTFNSELITSFAPDLPKVNIVPQDVGRVFINLFNNAFYAVHQKQKLGDATYKPVVEVTTASKDGVVEVRVRDNGTGIPDAIKEKIMQPFFTTKPSGEGTGLGLSLSYDIIAKGHGGTIKIDSKENEFTEFTIVLPS